MIDTGHLFVDIYKYIYIPKYINVLNYGLTQI